MTSILPANFDFTAPDKLGAEQRIKRLVKYLWPEWDDQSRAEIGNILISLKAFDSDVLAFYQDNQAREANIVTARLRRSVLLKAREAGYVPRTSSPAVAQVVFTLPSMAGDVTLPAGTRISTAEVTRRITHQLTAPLVIPAGTTSVTATVENSETREEAYLSSGQPDQVIRLRGTPYIAGTMSVVAADGTYVEVEDLLDSVGSDRHFTVTVDQDERPVVRFGDGVLGRIPTGTINVTFRTGGGTAGFVEAGKLIRLEGSFTDSFGTPAKISVTNPEKSSPGADRESIASIQRQVPRARRISGRALVSREDYEIAAETVGGVARALHLPDSLGSNQGLLAIIPEDLGVASPTLLAQVSDLWGPGGPYKKLNTYQITPVAGVYATATLSSVVYLRSSFTRSAARIVIDEALRQFFALYTTNERGELVRNSRIDFGYKTSGFLAWSDVLNVIRDSEPVLRVDAGPDGLLINGLRDDLALESQYFPKYGGVTLIDGVDGTVF